MSPLLDHSNHKCHTTTTLGLASAFIYGTCHGKLILSHRVPRCAVMGSCKQPLGKPQTFRALTLLGYVGGRLL